MTAWISCRIVIKVTAGDSFIAIERAGSRAAGRIERVKVEFIVKFSRAGLRRRQRQPPADHWDLISAENEDRRGADEDDHREDEKQPAVACSVGIDDDDAELCQVAED